MPKKSFKPRVGPRARMRSRVVTIRRGYRIPIPSEFGKVGRRVFFKVLAPQKVRVSLEPTGSLKAGRYQSSRLVHLLTSSFKRNKQRVFHAQNRKDSSCQSDTS